MHLLCQKLLYSNRACRIIIETEDGRFGWERRGRDWRYVAARARVLINYRRVVICKTGELELVCLVAMGKHRCSRLLD